MGEECTREKYLDVACSEKLLRLCNDIAAEPDKEKRGELKKHLPVITWQAYFPGRRLNKEAEPSGLFMLDIDHVENPWQLYSEKVAGQVKTLGIVYVGMTASRHGLRIVAKCREGLMTLAECQRWLASNLKVEYDGVCKDFARCSFLVHDSYTYFMDAKGIWTDEATPGMIYNPENYRSRIVSADTDMKCPPKSPAQVESGGEAKKKAPVTVCDTEGAAHPTTADQREGLFGGPVDYKGVPYETICKKWLEYTGGEPTEGERNARLFKLALRLRYITDFNAATMARVMPTYGLPKGEVEELCRHAVSCMRAGDMPKDLREVLEMIDKQIKLGGCVEEDEGEMELTTSTEKMPNLPPLLRQWVEIAPEDFKTAVTLCQLPILGALGSRLRARYLDGKLHAPSFQVSLEAPQASGKSFIVKLVEVELAQMKESDEAAREREREYVEKVAEMKMLNIKINADNKDEILGTKPKGIIRYLPATISITKLLQRMQAAKGLHCFAMAEEIDTVHKAFKRGFSSLGDLLRVSFDNDEFGQDYASENSFSGNVRLFYNTLYSGTPKAMRRFYPDVEDGLVSRVLFVTLPDQFGKPMPVWGEWSREQQQTVDIALTRLAEISLQGTEVQPEHEMKMEFVNKTLQRWISTQQQQAVETDDRTRDAFCRRAAVVGFRAAMVCWFLWGEKNTPTIRRQTSDFAVWVANNMLNQHLLRFNLQPGNSNVNHWEDIYSELPDEFTRAELGELLKSRDIKTHVRMVVYKWKLLGIVKDMEVGRTGDKNNKIKNLKYKKIKK